MESVKKLFGLGQYQVVYVKSNIDNKEYLVRDLPDKQQAADLLAKVRIKLNNLKVHLEMKYPDKPQVKQLIKNYRDDPKRFFEATPDAEFTSYSVNKGESIHLCLRQREKNDESLVNEDVMVFVSIHEMGHILTESLGHGPDFWNNFAWILKEAESIGIYKHQNFKAHPVKYCGMSITDEPTYDSSTDGTDLSVGTMK
jgi:hypothetical protein